LLKNDGIFIICIAIAGGYMPTLSSGLVLAGGYAKKLKKVIFTQLSSDIRAAVISSEDVALSIAELNSILYRILAEKLRVDKGDVVRIRIDYSIDTLESLYGGRRKLVWHPETLSIEVFRRDSSIAETLKSNLTAFWSEASRQIARYVVRRVRDTSYGSSIYEVMIGDEVVGYVDAYKVAKNEILLIDGAVLKPTPAIIRKAKLQLSGNLGDEVEISRSIARVSIQVSEDEARKVVEMLKKRG
jgi:hypothetical protein